MNLTSRRGNSTGGNSTPTQLFTLRRHTTTATSSTDSTGSSPMTRMTTSSTTTTTNFRKLSGNLRLLPPTPVTMRDLKKLNQLILPVSYPPSFYKEPLLDGLTSMVTRIAYWGGGDGLGDRERGHCVGGMRCRVQEEEVSTAHYDDDNEKEEMDPITWERRPRRLRPNSNAAAPPKKKTIKIYIMSLAVRSPYRNVGVGSALINYLLELPGSIRVPSSYSNSADPDASTAFCIYSTPSLPPPPPVSTFIIPTASPAELKALKEAVEIEAAVWEDNEEAIEWYAKRGFDVNSGGVVRGYYKKLKPDGARLVRYRWVKGEGARRLLRPGARGRLSWI